MEGLERAPGSWAFFLPPELDSWPRTLLLDPGHLWLGELTSNLGGLPGVSPVKIKGISAPWGRPTYGLRNLALSGRLPLSFLLLGKRGSRWPSPGFSAQSRGGDPLSPSCCVRPVICCGPRVPGAPLGAGPPMALGSAQIVFAAASLSPSPVRRVAATGPWIPSPRDCANPPSSQLRPVPRGPAQVPLGKPGPLFWNNTATSPQQGGQAALRLSLFVTPAPVMTLVISGGLSRSPFSRGGK